MLAEAQNYLPKDVLSRPKAGFNVPVGFLVAARLARDDVRYAFQRQFGPSGVI